MGQVEINLYRRESGRTGAYNTSIVPAYKFNLTAAQNLLLSAMENPLTRLTTYNGHSAASGEFNNTFGCSASALQANGGTCKSPVAQTIPMNYATGNTLNGAIVTQLAEAINNITLHTTWASLLLSCQSQVVH